MQRDLLSHLPVVRAVAQCRGFAAAAALLGMSPSAVSHAIKTVEYGLGLPLFARTTRSVSLTEAGTSFLNAIGPALATIEEAAEQVRSAKGTVTGVLRLSVPRLALRVAMTPVIAEMAWRHPELIIEVVSDDRLVDIVAEGFDAGIRLGEMIDEDMIAVPLDAALQGDYRCRAVLPGGQRRAARDRRSAASQLHRVPVGHGRRHLCLGTERRRRRRCIGAGARNGTRDRPALRDRPCACRGRPRLHLRGAG